MNSFNSAAIMIGGIAMAALGGYQFSQVGSAPFNYENASEAEQIAFLENSAKPLKKQIKRALINPSGVGTTMSLTDTEVNAFAKKISFTIRVSGGMRTDEAFDNARSVALKKVCPGYLQSQLGKNEVRIVQTFVDGKKQELEEITISKYYCEKYG